MYLINIENYGKYLMKFYDSFGEVLGFYLETTSVGCCESDFHAIVPNLRLLFFFPLLNFS